MDSPTTTTPDRNESATTATAWCDGAALPNPGAIGIGYLIRRPGHADIRHGEFRRYGTNNEAELHALKAVTKKLRELDVREAVVHSDSRIAIGWFTPPAGIDATWTPRAQNAVADQLATAAAGNRLEPIAGQRRTFEATLGAERRRQRAGGYTTTSDLLDITDAESGQTLCKLIPVTAGEWSKDDDTGRRIRLEATVKAFAPHRGKRPARVLWHYLAYPRLAAETGGRQRREPCDRRDRGHSHA